MKTVGKFILPDSNEFAARPDAQKSRHKGLPGHGRSLSVHIIIIVSRKLFTELHKGDAKMHKVNL